MTIENKSAGKKYTAAIGTSAPDFALPDERGETWRLSDHKGKITVLLFYPKNETLVCTRQLCSVRDHWADYMEARATVVGISPGTIDGHARFSSNYRLPMPILADENRNITKLYVRHALLPISFVRAVFVVDARGIIRKRKIVPRAFRPSDDEILKAVRTARVDAMIHWSGEPNAVS